jgi:hypothetical protein
MGGHQPKHERIFLFRTNMEVFLCKHYDAQLVGARAPLHIPSQPFTSDGWFIMGYETGSTFLYSYPFPHFLNKESRKEMGMHTFSSRMFPNISSCQCSDSTLYLFHRGYDSHAIF